MPIVFCFVLIIEPINALGKILKQYRRKWKIKVSHLSGPEQTLLVPSPDPLSRAQPPPWASGGLASSTCDFLHRMVLGPMSERAQSAWGL